jgi:hypothetical protein
MYLWMYDMIVYISDRSQTLDRLHSFKVLEESRTAYIGRLKAVRRRGSDTKARAVAKEQEDAMRM